MEYQTDAAVATLGGVAGFTETPTQQRSCNAGNYPGAPSMLQLLLHQLEAKERSWLQRPQTAHTLHTYTIGQRSCDGDNTRGHW